MKRMAPCQWCKKKTEQELKPINEFGTPKAWYCTECGGLVAYSI